MTNLIHILGWFVIWMCLGWAGAIQGERMRGLDKFEHTVLALSVLYLVGVSLVRW